MEEHQRRDVQALMAALQQALALEGKFQPRLQLPTASVGSGVESGEITSSMRDGAAHVLRCLKVWFDLPSCVLLSALNLMDRFMSRMKARPKHLSCIAISAFHLAACQWAQKQPTTDAAATTAAATATTKPRVPEPQDLVMISQCKCTAGDIARMEKIVEAKLGCLPQEEPVTSLTFLSLYHSLLEAALQQQLDLAILSCKLETVCCDAAHASVPSSRLALALLFVEVGRLPQHCAQRQRALDVLVELQQLLRVDDEPLRQAMTLVASVLVPYDGYAGYAPSHRQRLTWKLSRRTLKQLRPTEKLVSVLPTIEENRQYGQVRQKRNRGGDKSNGGGAGVASSSSSSSSSSASSASSLPSSSAASSAAPVPSPRKMRPSPPTADADAWAAASASASLPFPTKEDFASFFDAYSPAYPFRFLFGIDDDQQQTTGPCTA